MIYNVSYFCYNVLGRICSFCCFSHYQVIVSFCNQAIQVRETESTHLYAKWKEKFRWMYLKMQLKHQHFKIQLVVAFNIIDHSNILL